MDAGKLRWGYVVSDFAFSALAWGIISVFRFHEVACRQGFATLGSFLSDNMVLAGLFLVPVVWLFLFYLSGYYNRPLGKSRFDELECTAISVLSGTVLFFFLLILNDVPESFRSYYKLFFHESFFFSNYNTFLSSSKPIIHTYLGRPKCANEQLPSVLM